MIFEVIEMHPPRNNFRDVDFFLDRRDNYSVSNNTTLGEGNSNKKHTGLVPYNIACTYLVAPAFRVLVR